MAFTDVYRKQVELLVRTIPYVAEEESFALKGGTAINLFHRNMPRLSVDIDLTYLPIEDREQSLAEIEAALRRIAASMQAADSSIQITESHPKSQPTIDKLFIRSKDQVQIKVEVNPVLRGCVGEPEEKAIAEKAEDQFGFAEIKVLPFADLYAGKIMAALDRQHPRDLFDVSELLETEGISDELRQTLIVYLVSHDHPPHKLLSADCRDQAHEYEHNFVGMTEREVPLDDLYGAHADLKAQLVTGMPDDHKAFLTSFYQRTPDWELLGLPEAANLPAVRWREINLDRAGKETCADIAEHLVEVLR